MATPLRIQRPGTGLRNVSSTPTDSLKFYTEKLLKLIPGEAVGLFLVGIGFIPLDAVVVQSVWALVCLGAVVAVKAFGTGDRRVPPDWLHVAISSVAFMVWLYSLGREPFVSSGLYVPYVGSLLVLAFTFAVPFLIRGNVDQ